MRIFVLTDTYKLHISRKSHLCDHPTVTYLHKFTFIPITVSPSPSIRRIGGERLWLKDINIFFSANYWQPVLIIFATFRQLALVQALSSYGLNLQYTTEEQKPPCPLCGEGKTQQCKLDPKRLERGGPCLLLKMRWMGTKRVQMKAHCNPFLVS